MTDVELRESLQAGEVRQEVRSWLEANWNSNIDASAWRVIVVDSGWACPTWPTQWYGRGLPLEMVEVIEEEFERVQAPYPGVGTEPSASGSLPGSAILGHGTDDQKRGLLRQVLNGELGQSCLLYSEPGAGSDLAGLQTRAERDGDGYIVNGQKVWTSGAATADYGLLVARTNWDVPKHRGISFFIFPMKQKGVEVRPIKQMTGESHFNEVFFTDAWVPTANLIGDENDGWRVLQTALTAERVSLARSRNNMGQQAEDETETRPEILIGASDLVETANRTNRLDDPLVQQAIAQIHILRLVNQWNNERAAAETRAGSSSSLGSVGKLAISRIIHTTGALKRLMLGASSLVYDYDDPDSYPDLRSTMWAFAMSIGGGTDQIQRNIIGERVLGLPKGLEPDRGLPFREARKGAATRRFSAEAVES